jgi:aspartyl/asparaginyl beta-hydroxylase (cupin superfamily)
MFVDPGILSCSSTLTARWQEIRDEALALPATAAMPWVQREMYGEGWSLVVLHALGHALPPLADCPATAAALRHIDGLAMAAFSRLAPGAHVRPHQGWGARVHRIHLGLVVPSGCWLRVGAETRPWSAGGLLAFDDTIEHEARNPTASERWVLMIDALRPGLSGPPYERNRLPPEVLALAKHLDLAI